MKTRIISKTKVIILLILIYIIVLAGGFLFSTGITWYRNNNMRIIAQHDMEYYYDHQGEFNSQVLQNLSNNFVYDSSGQLIDSITSDDLHTGYDYDAFARSLMNKASSSDGIYTITFNRELRSHIALAVLLPTSDGGWFMVFRQQGTLYSMLMVMFFTTTLAIVMIGIFTVFWINKALELERVQREYVDNISHELKSPLSSIRALTETMNDGMVETEEKKSQYYRVILSEVSRLEKTVTSMLELSKIQNKQGDCSLNTVTSVDCFSQIVSKYDALCDDIGLEFSISPALESWPTLYTNVSMAARLLDILLNNAVKFAGVEGRVDVVCHASTKGVTICVCDSGSGISAADKPYIFKRFYKGDKAHNEKGSGLGLAIANEIAHSLGQKIWLESTSEKGTEFRFTL